MLDNLDNYPIVFTKNCMGAVLGDDRGIKDKVFIAASQDEVRVEPGSGDSVGKLVCRNAGANESLRALTAHLETAVEVTYLNFGGSNEPLDSQD